MAVIAHNGSYAQGADRRTDAGDLVYRTIRSDGSVNEEVVATDRGVDKSVLLYDSNSLPHVFFASSDSTDQVIYHLYQGYSGGWLKEAVVHFANQGGLYIYEISADIGKDDSFHLLVLKTRSNPDSADFFDAYLDSHLYHVTNRRGSWKTTLIHRYDTFYTDDNTQTAWELKARLTGLRVTSSDATFIVILKNSFRM